MLQIYVAKPVPDAAQFSLRARENRGRDAARNVFTFPAETSYAAGDRITILGQIDAQFAEVFGSSPDFGAGTMDLLTVASTVLEILEGDDIIDTTDLVADPEYAVRTSFGSPGG